MDESTRLSSLIVPFPFLFWQSEHCPFIHLPTCIPPQLKLHVDCYEPAVSYMSAIVISQDRQQRLKIITFL